MARVAEIKAGQGVSGGKRQAVVAAVFFQGGEKVIEHLGKGQGDHDKVHADRTQTERSDDQQRQADGRVVRPQLCSR